jgi:rfaE bifunctional protein nucleotidyltransferase chain/domain
LAKPKKLRKLSSKIKSPKALGALLKNRKKRKFVFTNGVFDLLHKGHVTYLEQARRMGDGLIVAMNSDASVKRLKGPSRPINPLADRIDVIAALESVDFVTWFEEDTPINVLKLIKPDIYTKGGDYTISQLPEAKEMKSWDGKVKILPFVKGRSTTETIQKAKGSKKYNKKYNKKVRTTL